jgi:hypothetical protein
MIAQGNLRCNNILKIFVFLPDSAKRVMSQLRRRRSRRSGPITTPAWGERMGKRKIGRAYRHGNGLARSPTGETPFDS